MNLLLQNVAPAERVQMLADNADKTETGKYNKRLTQQEMDLRRELFTNNAITIGDLNEEKKQLVKEIKDKIDPLTATNDIIRSELKTGITVCSGIIYHIANHETGFMETYDEYGEFLTTRRLLPEEKQARIYIAKAM